MIRLLGLILVTSLAACGAQPTPPRGSDVAPIPSASPPALVSLQDAAAEAVLPAIVAARELVEPIAPPAPPRVAEVHPDAVALIVHFEILSPSYYDRRLQGVICPGGASGPTWGIGFDGGHQTEDVIEHVWVGHAEVARLQKTSGAIGQTRCRASAATLVDVRTGLAHAERVFRDNTLPRYHDLARRTFHRGWDRLPWVTQGVLVSLVFNRGASMTGETRREMRKIRDECVPAGDPQCIARETIAMSWVWRGKDIEEGMRRRREAEARLAVAST